MVDRVSAISLGLVVLMVSVGQIFLKSGVEDLDFSGNIFTIVINAVSNPYLITSSALYGICVILYIYVLIDVPISIAYPLIGASYGVVTILGIVFLNETLSMSRVFGTLFILIGVVLVGISN